MLFYMTGFTTPVRISDRSPITSGIHLGYDKASKPATDRLIPVQVWMTFFFGLTAVFWINKKRHTFKPATIGWMKVLDVVDRLCGASKRDIKQADTIACNITSRNNTWGHKEKCFKLNRFRMRCEHPASLFYCIWSNHWWWALTPCVRLMLMSNPKPYRISDYHEEISHF